MMIGSIILAVFVCLTILMIVIDYYDFKKHLEEEQKNGKQTRKIKSKN